VVQEFLIFDFRFLDSTNGAVEGASAASNRLATVAEAVRRPIGIAGEVVTCVAAAELHEVEFGIDFVEAWVGKAFVVIGLAGLW